jgi:hypothetical protein
MALLPNAGQGLIILEVLYFAQNDAPQSVELLWTNGYLVAENST